MKYIVTIVIVIIGVGVGVFYFSKSQQSSKIATIPALTPTPTIEITPVATTTPTPVVDSLSKSQVRKTIEDAINNKSYGNLQDLMTDNVIVILQATECCGPMSKSDATSQISYLNAATSPWNFNQNNPIAMAIKSNYPDNYGNSILGISDNNYVVAFQLNNDNKISKISMAVNSKLLVP